MGSVHFILLHEIQVVVMYITKVNVHCSIN